MTTPKQMEPNVNLALGNLLEAMMPTCTVLAEHTNTFPDHRGSHAEVLVTATGRSPVVVEAEFEPAPEAEDDARKRLALWHQSKNVLLDKTLVGGSSVRWLIQTT